MVEHTMDEHLRIPKISEGLVIDHIPAGQGLVVAKALGLDLKAQEGHVTLGLNFESGKLGRKDLIKVENRKITTPELNKIAFLAPGCTVKRIHKFKVLERIEISPPDFVDELLACLNPRCVSNSQREMATKFVKVKEKPLTMKCFYCERIYANSDIRLLS